MYVYETPVLNGCPLGVYSVQTGMFNIYPQYANMDYRSTPVQTPFSAAALALQGGKYPATTMSVPNEVVYPVQYYAPYQYNGGYGQRGLLPGSITTF